VGGLEVEVERTYHLNEDTPYHNNPKDIGTDMCQLIVPRKSQFESNTESLFVSPSSQLDTAVGGAADIP
jgi:hypothetical protein